MSFFKRLFGGGAKTPEGDACIACDSTELEDLAPQVYRCRSCGYTGGDGFAAYRANQRREEFAALSTEDLLTKTLNALENVRLALLAVVDGELDIASFTLGDTVDVDLETGSVSAQVGNVSVSLSAGAGMNLASLTEQERIELRNQRRAGLTKARTDLLALRPMFQALTDHGVEANEVLAQLEQLDQSGEANQQALAETLSFAGTRCSEALSELQ